MTLFHLAFVILILAYSNPSPVFESTIFPLTFPLKYDDFFFEPKPEKSPPYPPFPPRCAIVNNGSKQLKQCSY